MQQAIYNLHRRVVCILNGMYVGVFVLTCCVLGILCVCVCVCVCVLGVACSTVVERGLACACRN